MRFENFPFFFSLSFFVSQQNADAESQMCDPSIRRSSSSFWVWCLSLDILFIFLFHFCLLRLSFLNDDLVGEGSDKAAGNLDLLVSQLLRVELHSARKC